MVYVVKVFSRGVCIQRCEFDTSRTAHAFASRVLTDSSVADRLSVSVERVSS